ncbi:MAG: hypothetical protein IJM88_03920 [Bacteroidales bacterium]|nr:hypothetical protein [Bacteroidales bacterium]
MRRNRIATIVLAALSLLNFLIGGIMGFVLPNSENRKVFIFIFFVCLVAAIITLICDWVMLKQANEEREYKVLRLRKGRLVREPRRLERDYDGLRALQMGISAWFFSLVVPLFAFAMIWPNKFWMMSCNVLAKSLVFATVLVEFVIEIIIVCRKQKRGEEV